MRNYYYAYKLVAAIISPFVTRERISEFLTKHKNIDWESVAYIAGNHSIVQVLYPALVDKNLINIIPEEFFSYIQELNQLNSKRNLLMKSQLAAFIIQYLINNPKSRLHFR